MVGESLHYCFRHVPAQCCWRSGWHWRNGGFRRQRAFLGERGKDSAIDPQLCAAFWHFGQRLLDIDSYPSHLGPWSKESGFHRMSLYVAKGGPELEISSAELRACCLKRWTKSESAAMCSPC